MIDFIELDGDRPPLTGQIAQTLQAVPSHSSRVHDPLLRSPPIASSG